MKVSVAYRVRYPSIILTRILNSRDPEDHSEYVFSIAYLPYRADIIRSLVKTDKVKSSGKWLFSAEILSTTVAHG